MGYAVDVGMSEITKEATMDIFGSEQNLERWYARHENERAIEHAEQRAAEARHRGDLVMAGQWENAAERARLNMC